ncbi:hypothetical protein [Microbispora sp. CA-102843]|uniref:hypothetical protein n=1 Tax=Microbispora sp. CA-102843 TaxID=3239952 RepID=UPI003D950837
MSVPTPEALDPAEVEDAYKVVFPKVAALGKSGQRLADAIPLMLAELREARAGLAVTTNVETIGTSRDEDTGRTVVTFYGPGRTRLDVDLGTDLAEPLALMLIPDPRGEFTDHPEDGFNEQDEPACRLCGCTEDAACVGGCHWVPDPLMLGELCSACLDAALALAVAVWGTGHAEPLSDEQIAQIRASIPASYPPPWRVETADDGFGYSCWNVLYATDNPIAGLIATVPDYGSELALFIARARQDVPALLAEIERLHQAETETAAIRSLAFDILNDIEQGRIHDAERLLREALSIPVANEPTPEQARLRQAFREAGERASICACSEFGPCPACAPEAAALTAALAEEAGDLDG